MIDLLYGFSTDLTFLPTQVGANPDHTPGGDSQVLVALPSS